VTGAEISPDARPPIISTPIPIDIARHSSRVIAYDVLSR
jgi:hypothetical protein